MCSICNYVQATPVARHDLYGQHVAVIFDPSSGWCLSSDIKLDTKLADLISEFACEGEGTVSRSMLNHAWLPSTQVVERPLGLSERMLALAAAISIDYDYFSRHSQGGGGLLGPMLFPMPPVPYPAPEGSPEGAEGSPEGSPEGTEGGPESSRDTQADPYGGPSGQADDQPFPGERLRL